MIRLCPESGSLERPGTGLRDCPIVVDAAGYGCLGAVRPALRVAMLMLHGATPRDREARDQLREVLPDAELTEPDQLGVFEITLEAPDLESALERVWDAVAAAGVDDHILFLEHPELPEHWRAQSRRPR